MSKPKENKLKKNHIKSEYCYFDGKRKLYLTKRESQCFSWIIRAKQTKIIGERLDLSTRTVEKYIDILKEKLGCNSKMELMGKAIEDEMTNTILSWADEK